MADRARSNRQPDAKWVSSPTDPVLHGKCSRLSGGICSGVIQLLVTIRPNHRASLLCRRNSEEADNESRVFIERHDLWTLTRIRLPVGIGKIRKTLREV